MPKSSLLFWGYSNNTHFNGTFLVVWHFFEPLPSIVTFHFLNSCPPSSSVTYYLKSHLLKNRFLHIVSFIFLFPGPCWEISCTPTWNPLDLLRQLSKNPPVHLEEVNRHLNNVQFKPSADKFVINSTDRLQFYSFFRLVIFYLC